MAIERSDGNLPVLHVKGENIGETWENSVVELYNNGIWYKRGGHKDKGRLQVDSTMIMEIKNPLSDFYHKYMTCALEDLLGYQMEILGAKDSWVHLEEGSTKWPYHYHERIAHYPKTNGELDQLDEVLRNLTKRPNTRQAQVITWVPERDTTSRDPPCLQSIWFSLIPNEETGNFKLNMNYRFRSRNVMIAAPMNQFGLATFQEYTRRNLSESLEKEIETGRMVDMVDSYHVSAQDQHILNGFMERLGVSKEKSETIENRVYDREMSMEIFSSAHSRVKEKIIEQTKKELKEKGEEYRLEKEFENIEQISKIVSELNGY